MIKVFIDGNQGTTGLRIVERLSARPDIELTVLPEDLRKDFHARVQAIQAADVAFLCLPDNAAREIAAVASPRLALLDTSTAHRTDPAWSYGFPELSATHRANIASGGKVAVPGCHASGFISLIYPLIAGGLVDAAYPFVCHSLTGYSGGGKSMIAAYQAQDRPAALNAPRQYGITQQHKHLPEMQAVCQLNTPPAFSPIVADYYAGMEVTVSLFRHLMSRPMSLNELRAFFSDFYADAALISVRTEEQIQAENGMISANALSGSDRMEIIITGNDDRPLLISRFDNLGKGASGAAIQCMNIALGMDETTGLVLKN